MIVDNEFKGLIPPLSKEEYTGLEQSIITEGCRESIITWNNIIIDGHNRYEICTKNNIDFKTSEKNFTDKNEAKIWIIRNQFNRRNISIAQRCDLAYKLKELLEPKARENLSLGGGDKKSEDYKSGFQKSEKAITPINVTKELAKDAGVSVDTMSKFIQIKEKAQPEQIEKINTGELSINEVYKDVRKQQKIKEVEEKVKAYKEQSPNNSFVDIHTTTKKYNIIYADPPWQYWESGQKNQSLHYKTMPVDEIIKLPVSRVTEKDCILFLWVTFPILKESFDIIKSWGFEYSTCGFVWVKKNTNNSNFFGCGSWTRANTELCLIATKGKITRLDASISQIIEHPIDEHSKKPNTTRGLITKLVGELPRIELFARQQVQGWDCWGNGIV